jgi:hypothetical protein
MNWGDRNDEKNMSMKTLLAKSSIYIDLKHTICRAYRKRNLVTQLGGHYILWSEWAPQKIPHLPPENLDTSFSLFHASREKLTYSPAKARVRENKTPRDRQKKDRSSESVFVFVFETCGDHQPLLGATHQREQACEVAHLSPLATAHLSVSSSCCFG